MENINEIMTYVDEQAARALDQSVIVLEASLVGEVVSDEDIRQQVEINSLKRELQLRHVAAIALSAGQVRPKFHLVRG